MGQNRAERQHKNGKDHIAAQCRVGVGRKKRYREEDRMRESLQVKGGREKSETAIGEGRNDEGTTRKRALNL